MSQKGIRRSSLCRVRTFVQVGCDQLLCFASDGLAKQLSFAVAIGDENKGLTVRRPCGRYFLAFRRRQLGRRRDETSVRSQIANVHAALKGGAAKSQPLAMGCAARTIHARAGPVGEPLRFFERLVNSVVVRSVQPCETCGSVIGAEWATNGSL